MAEAITFDVLARDRASATFNKIGQSTQALETRFARLTRAATGIATTLVGAQIGKSVLDAAGSFELSRSRLETITKNIGGNFDALSKQVDTTDAHMERLGFTNAETEGSLASLESVTRNPIKAMKDLSLAADIARGRNIGLSEATLILQRVETGHVAQLAKLGIATKDAAGHTLSQAQALDMLTRLYGGAASRYADTFAGKQAAVSASLRDSAAQIGVALLPAAVDLARVLQHDVLPPVEATAKFFDRNRAAIEPVVKLALELGGVWKAYSLITRGTQAVQALFTRSTIESAAALRAEAVAGRAAAASVEAVAVATRTAAVSEGALIGERMAANLNTRGLGTLTSLGRNAGGIAGAGALTAGAFTHGTLSTALSVGGGAALLTSPLGPEVSIPAGVLAGLVTVGLSGPGSKQRRNEFLTQALSGPAGLKQVQDIAARTMIPKNTAVRGGGTVTEMHDEATAALKLAAALHPVTDAENLAAAADGRYGQTVARTAAQIVAASQKSLNFKQSQDAVRQAMHDAAQTAADNGRALVGNSNAALANRAAVASQVSAVLNVITVMQQNGATAAAQASMLEILTQALEVNATNIYGNKGAVDALLRSLNLVPAAVDAATLALARLPQITQSAFANDNVTQGAIHQLNQASSAAKQAGVKTAQSFTDGFTPVVAKGAAKAATSAATAAADAMKQRFTADIQTVRDAFTSVRDQVAGFADFSAQGTDTLGASGINTDVRGQLKAKAAQLQRFATLFNRLDRLHLDPHLMAQFAQIGPDAIPAMQALLAGGRREISQVNRIERSIQTAASRVGATETAEQNAGLIHHDLQTLPPKLARAFANELHRLGLHISLTEIDRRSGSRVRAGI